MLNREQLGFEKIRFFLSLDGGDTMIEIVEPRLHRPHFGG